MDTTPAAVMDVELELDPEWIKVRAWWQTQLEKAGVGTFTAYRLALIPNLDYRKAVRMKELGMSDDLILDQFLDYGEEE